MKSTELRSGNLVNMGEYLYQPLNAYNIYQLSLLEKGGTVADFYHKITPIELTEDWLKRLGCIEQRINSTKKNYWNKEKDFSVDVEFSFSGNLYYYNVSKDRRKPLIHVHKLQNLHYELKDEELKIK